MFLCLLVGEVCQFGWYVGHETVDFGAEQSVALFHFVFRVEYPEDDPVAPSAQVPEEALTVEVEAPTKTGEAAAAAPRLHLPFEVFHLALGELCGHKDISG